MQAADVGEFGGSQDHGAGVSGDKDRARGGLGTLSEAAKRLGWAWPRND